MRAARQQDFLRQAKNAAGVRKLLASGLSETPVPDPRVQPLLPGRQVAAVEQADHLDAQARAVPRAGEPEGARGGVQGLRRAERPQLDSNLYYRDSDLRRSFREFMQVKESDEPRENTAERGADRRPLASARAPVARAQADGGARARGRAARGRGPGGARRSQAQDPVLLPDQARGGLRLLRHRAADLQAQGRAGQEARGVPARAQHPAASASTTASRAWPGRRRRSSTTPIARSGAATASSGSTTTASACGSWRGARSAACTGSPTR